MTIRELLETLDIRHDGKRMVAGPASKLTPELLQELKTHKPMLERAFTCPKVRQVIEATNGKIVDVGEFETAVMMNERMDREANERR